MPEHFLIGPWRRASVAAFVAALSVLCLLQVVIGLSIVNRTNGDVALFDQSAYAQMAREMANAGYPGYTDGVRNPLFPWVAARILDPGAPDFFAAGKKLNILLGAVGTAVIGVFFAVRMGPLAAWNAAALAGLAALLPISTFFGAEAMFYVLFLFVCACALRLLTANPVWLYALLGIVAGLAWLAKPSATPFLALFAAFSGVRLLLTRCEAAPWFLRAPAWRPGRLWLGGAACLAVYGALISPRLVHAAREWGSPGYSLPAFWFWADDWKTCTEKYIDCRAVTLAKLPPDEQPTAAGYFRRHSPRDAWERLRAGAGIRLGQFFHPEGKLVREKSGKPRRIVLPHRGAYLGGLAVLAAVMGAFALGRGTLDRLGPVALPVLLWLAAFTVYVLAMGWYYPIGSGHRFIMTLFLPTVWILAQGAEQLRAAADSRWADGVFLAGQGVLFGCLSWRLAVLFLGEPFEKISYAF